ncbi:MAG: hypothetical protein LBJ73_01440 [Rickettsiales bacterium]|jgi:hypothetical protein|nr:hypothetical protein [Rickettsiales bacterium]
MAQSRNIKLFENQNIRTLWDEAAEKWYFSIVDVVGALTGRPVRAGRNAQRMKKIGNK